MNNRIKIKGFTIIEVVLVLAIAGLIFLMVFIALPTLQKSQRDTQRKDDVSRIETQIQAYQSNNTSKIPTTATQLTTFQTKYLTDNYTDPSTGNTYTLTYQASTTTAPSTTLGTITYYYKAKCDSSTTSGVTAANGNNYAMMLPLEGSKVPYCVSNA